jgi:hypothetical protein
MDLNRDDMYQHLAAHGAIAVRVRNAPAASNRTSSLAASPARMVKLTEQRKISRYVWVHLDEER